MKETEGSERERKWRRRRIKKGEEKTMHQPRLKRWAKGEGGLETYRSGRMTATRAEKKGGKNGEG